MVKVVFVPPWLRVMVILFVPGLPQESKFTVVFELVTPAEKEWVLEFSEGREIVASALPFLRV